MSLTKDGAISLLPIATPADKVNGMIWFENDGLHFKYAGVEVSMSTSN
jgi:hypothetical protein